MANYTDAKTLIASERQPLMTLHRSLLSLLPLVTLFLVSLLGWYLANFVISPLFLSSNTFFKHVPIRFLPIGPIFFLLVIAQRYLNDLWVFERDRVTHLHGRVSFRLEDTVIKYTDMRGIALNQGLLGRIFNFGNLSLETAAQKGAELDLIGIHAPEELANLIDDLRTIGAKAKDKTGSDKATALSGHLESQVLGE